MPVRMGITGASGATSLALSFLRTSAKRLLLFLELFRGLRAHRNELYSVGYTAERRGVSLDEINFSFRAGRFRPNGQSRCPDHEHRDPAWYCEGPIRRC